MEAKTVQHRCKRCEEMMQFDFNVDPYSTEVMIVNGKKKEKRIFIKNCPHCNELNMYISEHKEDWGNRKNTAVQKIFVGGMFSCLMMVILFCLIAYFAGKGLMTIFDWIF